jgi:phosphoglycolate phosphatase
MSSLASFKSDIAAVVLDMDGVLLRSNAIKHAAMLGLFDATADQRLTIAAYNQRSGGVPRRIKFQHIWEAILHRSYSAVVERVLAERYESALETEMLRAPLTEGVEQFIGSITLPRFVCTAAPKREALAILEANGLLQCFSGVYDGSTTKALALDAIVQHVGRGQGPVVFFGDAVADLEAAIEARVGFVGVTREANNFVGTSVPTIHDFSDIQNVWRRVAEATQM